VSQLSKARDPARRALLLVALIPLCFAYVRTALFLSDPGVCWEQPETGNWKPQMVAWGFPHSLSGLGHALDWPALEDEPRVTRPLANVFELFDTPFRALLLRAILIPPSLSLTWLFSLVASPLLLWLLLRRLGVERWIGLLAVALFVANPGVLSLEVMLFRPGKALANAVILFCLWLAAGQDAKRRQTPAAGRLTLRFAVLCAVVWFSLFFDEVILIVYPALALLFPRLVFRSKGTIALFALIPAAYAVVIVKIMPALTRLAGYPPITRRYSPAATMVGLLTFREPAHSYRIVLKDIVDNSRSVLQDSFGLIRPDLPHRPYYVALFVTIVLLGAAYAGFAAIAAWRRLRERHERVTALALGENAAGIACRAGLAFLGALVYEGVLMSVSLGNGVEPRMWGLYYYGVFCVVFVVLGLATLANMIRPPVILATVFTLAVCCATTDIFPATNQGYKYAHYYPYDPPRLSRIFDNTENRFAVPHSNSALLREKSLALWRTRTTHQPVLGIPFELSPLIYELGLLPTQIRGNPRSFDLTWQDGQPRIQTHE
jgi:hypothetical protein